MSQPLDFQSIIFSLNNYWARQGCLIWQPYYSQVGAGTMNPATILRVLGPEPWKVGYVEPSIRPDDGRYGENPNRMQQHYQYQVILKPDPGNPQELYLRSLEEIGIDPRRHDIRFVEDNWESPALGAWGLGWEVWLDGQEITQFTYFQQAGGMVLDPVSVEITYGMERIAIALQRVPSFRDIRWNDKYTYGDVNLTGEQEHSAYYFEVADVERLRQMYNLYEAEAEAALSKNLILPAHDYILKCSHTFNVLDTRGAVGVTERQALFSRMRDLSRRIAEAYFAKRQTMEFPWSDKKGDQKPKEIVPEVSKVIQDVLSSDKNIPMSQTANPLLLEIGTEEMPVSDLQSALMQLQESVPALVNDLRLSHGDIKVMGTPRRLVIYIENLAAQQEDRTIEVKGPPVSRSYDAMGLPTAAARGFANSKGIPVEMLEKREIDGGQYIVAHVHEIGRPTPDIFTEAFPKLIANLRFEKPMRWNYCNTYFSRPIRWLLALWGNQMIPFEFSGLKSGQTTRLLRFSEKETVEVSDPTTYFALLAAEGIVLDPDKRKSIIASQVEELTIKAGGDPNPDMSLLEEVTNLVEAPTALLGNINESYLKLPTEVLVSVMKKHQRYFPVKSKDGKLLPHFIAVRNGDKKHLDIVTDGNEQVIRARFADANFFISHDLKHCLEDFLPRLDTLTFQLKLGSMLDKSKRIVKLVEHLIALIGLNETESQTVLQAASLCKADLVTHMVIEMTALQGIMGKYYALQCGESQAVAQAILEHYLPRFAGDDTPRSQAGLLVGIADRLDTLAGLFAVGMAPSGTKDPFALRRAAIGLVQNLMVWDLDFNINQGLTTAAESLPIQATAESQKACLDFIVGRQRNYLLEQGYRFDVVDAILEAQYQNPAGVKRAIDELTGWIKRPDWTTILPAYARCVRITRDQTIQYKIQPEQFTLEDENDLYQSLISAEGVERKTGSPNDMLKAFVPMIPVINRFFDNVLVMDENPDLRANRLGLLQRIAAFSTNIADFSRLEGF